MKKLLFIPFLLISARGWGAISQIGGAAVSYSAATSTTVYYSPTSGNAVVFCLGRNGVTSGETVVDNLSNSLSGGTVLKSTGTTGVTIFYQYPVPSGVTSYTATWTTARGSGATVEEYSGGSAFQVLTTSMTTATGTAEALTTTSQVNNSWVIFCEAHASGTFSTTTGNQRQQSNNSSGRTTEGDNTVATAGSLSYKGTGGTSGIWGIVGIELDPTVTSSRRRPMVVE